jgi:hypothetical protein
MNPILRNTLAVIAGLVLGGIANMGIIMVSSYIIPLPEGVDPSDMESIKSSMHLYQPRHFILPFAAHALGTLIGAFVTAVIAVGNRRSLALLVGLLFLVAGIINVFMLPAPAWFIIIDLSLAYIPMSWLGWKMRG